jgi:L-alanine-DL-glutamate epimerase-like enolase superfamily enzyme
MNRRHFLAGCALLPLAPALPTGAEDELRRHTIARITGFRHCAPRPKLVGKNSHLDIHGDSTGDDILIFETSQGATGFGSGRLTKETAQKILGFTLAQLWDPQSGSIGPLGRFDHALFDLVSKVLDVPAWKLLAPEPKGPELVPVYDGSIYFNDLLPEFEKQGVARLVEEAHAGRERGFRAFKIKVGRGYKWMEKTAGFQRDIEVVRALRESLGPDIQLMVDANNGFALAETLRWLEAAGPENLYFVEEMFPENVEEDLALKDYIHKKGWATRVADGESAGNAEHFTPYLESRSLDILQPDIRAFGLSLQARLALTMQRLNPDARLAPHNWGSHLGGYMQLVLARAIPNFAIAEIDFSTSDLFDSSAFIWKDGAIQVPAIPGCGLAMRQDVFRDRYSRSSWTATRE